jgi:NaMN:DMB phosphoribosyltransferase
MEVNDTGEKEESEKDDGMVYLTAGGGLTAVAVAGFAAGAVCPVCVVGAPVLMGYGLYKKMKSRKKDAE